MRCDSGGVDKNGLKMLLGNGCSTVVNLSCVCSVEVSST